MNRLILFLLIFSFTTSMCTKIDSYEWEDGRWVDLTYDYSDETLYWPTSSTFKMDTVFVGITEGGFYYESFAFCTAAWIIENRNISAVGLDTPSLDYGQSTLFEAHQILFEQNIPGFENVANLDQLPPYGAYIIALPMKIRDGSGAPLRIVAHIRE